MLRKLGVIIIKITIDTKEDGHEEIKRVIQLLSSLVKREIKVNKDLFSSGGEVVVSESSNNAFVSMFGGAESEKKEAEVFNLDLGEKEGENQSEAKGEMEGEEEPKLEFF